MRSAKQMADMLGTTPQKINLKLKDLGYLKGSPGNWELTEEGKRHGYEVTDGNGCGGYAMRSWSYFMWTDDVVYKLGDPEEYLNRVNSLRKKFGAPFIDSFDIHDKK